jgi:hypothetical protein
VKTVFRRAAIGAVLGVAVLGVTACSLLLDWGQYTDGAADGGGPPIGPSCGTYSTCAMLPDPDGGWTGPVVLYDSQSRPPCSNVVSYYDFAPSPASCAACTCSSLTKDDCQDPVATYYTDSNCGTACGHAPVQTAPNMIMGPCTAPACGGASFTLAAPTFGPCTPDGGKASVATPFVLRASACADAISPATGSCAAGQTCLPTPSTPDAPRLCVMATADVGTCPAEYPYGPEAYYTDTSQLNDMRGCSPCSCGTPSGTCTFVGNVERAPNSCATGIPSPIPNLILPLPCTQYTSDNGGLYTFPGALQTQGGSCPPSGGAPIGTATPTGPTTKFCCTTAPSGMP